MSMKKMFGSLLRGGVMFALLSVTAKANYGGAFEYVADGTVTQVQDGIMPSVGEVDSLVFLVEFPDIKHNETNTVEYAENVFLGREPIIKMWCREYARHWQISLMCHLTECFN